MTATVQEPDNIPDFTFAGEYNNQFIYYHTLPLSWTDARAKAQANNGDLVIINNAVDNNYFTSVTTSTCWIGFYQDLNDPNYLEPSGGWKWIDGTPLSYSNWAANEPNDGATGGQDFGCFNYGGIGFWDDYQSPLPFIMAIDINSMNSLSTSCFQGNDGSTYVTAGGGTGSYSYVWDNGQTTDTAYNLTAGDYIVIVTDANGCTATDTATITQPDLITGKDSIIACDTYNWIDGNSYTTSNNAATHTLTAANGCDSVVTLDLTINNSFFALETLTECDSLTWAVNGVTYFTSGTYYDSTLTTNNCDSVYQLDLTINNSPSIDLGADTTLICAGTSQIIDAGTGFVSYLWSDGSTAQTLSATTAGTYTVTVTDANGCSSSDSMVIDVLTVDITQNDTTICEGDSLVLSISGSYYYYEDFENTIGNEWNKNTTFNYNNTKIFGDYGNDTVILTLNGLPNADSVTI